MKGMKMFMSELSNIYCPTPIESVINVAKIVTIHYFEFPYNYVFKGEKHDFWEFLYVDKGEVEVMADTNGYVLKQGDIIFHKPNEFHKEWANGKIAPNLVIVSFVCTNPAMDFFKDKILKISPQEKSYIAEIVREGKETYSNAIGGHIKLEKRPSALFGSEQLIKLNLEMLLINLIRNCNLISNSGRLNENTLDRMENDLVDNIVAFMHENIGQNLSFDDICNHFSLGNTYLKTLFKNKLNTGVMTYFKNLKIEEAKKLIREQQYNFSQIADMLGYISIHTFSRSFKESTSMSPSEYASSVKAIANL